MTPVDPQRVIERIEAGEIDDALVDDVSALASDHSPSAGAALLAALSAHHQDLEIDDDAGLNLRLAAVDGLASRADAACVSALKSVLDDRFSEDEVARAAALALGTAPRAADVVSALEARAARPDVGGRWEAALLALAAMDTPDAAAAVERVRQVVVQPGGQPLPTLLELRATFRQRRDIT